MKRVLLSLFLLFAVLNAQLYDGWNTDSDAGGDFFISDKLIPTKLGGKVLYVGTHAYFTYNDVDAAINAAVSGDMILVLPGTYTGHIDADVANVTIKSLEGPERTTLSLTMTDNAGIDIGADGIVLDGFTLTGNAAGSIIRISNSSDDVIVQNCIINSTGSATFGYSISTSGASGPIVRFNKFLTNSGDGAIWINKSVDDMQIYNNLFLGQNNTSGYAIQMGGFNEFEIYNNVIRAADGYAGSFASGIFPHTAVDGSAASDFVYIYNNDISDCAKGVRIGHSAMTVTVKDIFVLNNNFRGNTIAVYIDADTDNDPSTFSVNGNVFHDNGTDIDNQHTTELADGTHLLETSLLTRDITISDETPQLNFLDRDGADNDVNLTIANDLTVVTSGAEDATVTIQNMVDGTMRDMLVNVVEGDYTLTSYKGQIILKTANTTALTLETDQDALFASDILMSTGKVINWNSGNVTLTHSAGLLTLNEEFKILDDKKLYFGDEFSMEYDEDGNDHMIFAGVDINMSGKYFVNEQGRADHVSNTMPSPYYRFDGDDDRILLGNQSDILSQIQGSFTFWVKSVSTSGNQHTLMAVAKYSTAAIDEYSFGVDSDNNRLFITIRNNNSTVLTLNTPTNSFTVDVEHHIAMISDASIIKLYIDGILQTLTVTVGSNTGQWFGNLTTDADEIAFGVLPRSSDYITDFEGEMSTVKSFNLVLTDSEVAYYYAGGSVPFKHQGASQTLISPISDDAGVDNTANWTDINGALTHAASEYTYTVTTGASVSSFTDEAALTVGKRYRATVLSKDGTGTSASVRIRALTNADAEIQSGLVITTGGAYAIAMVEWTATETNNKVQIEIGAASVSDGQTILFDTIEMFAIGIVAEYDGSTMTAGVWYDKQNDLDGTVTGASLENKVAALEITDELIVDGGLTFSGLTADRLVATDGSNVLVSTITEANLESSVSDMGNILQEDEIDASSELAAIMDDEVGSGYLVFNTNPSLVDNLTATSSTTNQPLWTIENTTNDATAPIIRLENDRGAAGVDADVAGSIFFNAGDFGETQIDVVSIIGSLEESAVANVAGRLVISIMHDDGTPALDNFLDMSGDNGTPGEGFIKLNADLKDVNTIIGAVGEANAFFVQGSDGNVGIRMTNPEYALDVSSLTNDGIRTTGNIWMGTNTTSLANSQGFLFSTLSVGGTVKGLIAFSTPGGRPGIEFRQGASLLNRFDISYTSNNVFSLKFSDDPSSLGMHIKEGGNTGFGTTTPGTTIELADNTANAAHPFLTLLNDYEQATGEIAQTADIIFEFKGTIDSGSNYTNEEAAKISAYKIGDYWTGGGQDDNDAGLKFYTVTNGAYVLNSTLSDDNFNVIGDFTANTIASDGVLSGTTVTASTGFALGDGDYIGITGNEVLVFNTAGYVDLVGALLYIGGSQIDSDDLADVSSIAMLDESETVTGGWDFSTTAPTFTVGYTRHIDIDIGSATLGPTAPTATTVGTFRGLGFDADGEEVFFAMEVPSDWNGNTDMTLVIHWFPTSTDAVADGETVKWDITYRSISDGEAVDNGTLVSATATFTGVGGEIDKEHYETSITIDYDHAQQPLTVNDDVGFQLDRDVTGDTYSGAGIVYKLDLVYTSNALPRGG